LACSRLSERLRALALGLAGALALAGPAAAADEAPLAALAADGTRVTLAPEGGEALVVHFWASWCPECVSELPGLAREAERCAPGVRIVAVNVAEPRATAEAFLARHGIALPLLLDPEGRLWRRFARGLPANLFWTAQGREASIGPLDAEAWRARLAALGCVASAP
jgi:thiol-disulfide isomerase/thioredoxin